MALDDINFDEGNSRDFIVEIPEGTLNSPVDITVSEKDHFITELFTKLKKIFVLSD